MLELQDNYIVVNYDGHKSYGGNQRRSADQTIKKCGCGIVAALDTLLYLSRRCRWSDVPELENLNLDGTIAGELYEERLVAMKKSYFPVLYPLGTNGLALAFGMNRFFRRRRLPFRAVWHIAGANIWKMIEKMLESDIPVICAVGTNFPKFWGKKGLRLQVPDNYGKMHGSADAKAHFVTVTGMDEEWIQISSWGRKYYVSRQDFENYARKNSSPLLCGVLYIEHK